MNNTIENTENFEIVNSKENLFSSFHLPSTFSSGEYSSINSSFTIDLKIENENLCCKCKDKDFPIAFNFNEEEENSIKIYGLKCYLKIIEETTSTTNLTKMNFLPIRKLKKTLQQEIQNKIKNYKLIMKNSETNLLTIERIIQENNENYSKYLLYYEKLQIELESIVKEVQLKIQFIQNYNHRIQQLKQKITWKYENIKEVLLKEKRLNEINEKEIRELSLLGCSITQKIKEINNNITQKRGNIKENIDEIIYQGIIKESSCFSQRGLIEFSHFIKQRLLNKVKEIEELENLDDNKQNEQSKTSKRKEDEENIISNLKECLIIPIKSNIHETKEIKSNLS